MKRSIAATYDHRTTGDRFSVEVRVNGRWISKTTERDPFVTTTVRLGWRDRLRGLFGLAVTMRVDGDPEIVEDVSELDADYKGRRDSTRRAEWDAAFQQKLEDFSNLYVLPEREKP